MGVDVITIIPNVVKKPIPESSERKVVLTEAEKRKLDVLLDETDEDDDDNDEELNALLAYKDEVIAKLNECSASKADLVDHESQQTRKTSHSENPTNIGNQHSEEEEPKAKKVKPKETVCKQCQCVLPTPAALVLHTCYSIMDRKIQTDGASHRKRPAPGIYNDTQEEQKNGHQRDRYSEFNQ